MERQFAARSKLALARFQHLPGRVFEESIDYVYPELDSKTRTLPVRLKFDNSEGLLRPNMFGKVTLVAPVEREAVTIPTEAVIRTGRAERVILKTGEGSFRPRLITTGLTDSFGGGSRTEVVQGLEPGEEVVASAVVAWIAFLLPQPTQFPILAAGFVMALIYDLSMVGRAEVMRWYQNLRWPLTIVVVACLLLASTAG